MSGYVTIILAVIALFLAYRVFYRTDNYSDLNMSIPTSTIRVGQERYLYSAGSVAKPLDPELADDRPLSSDELKEYGYKQ